MKAISKVEFGDFQTPIELSLEVCRLLCRMNISPSCVIEPTCGKGSFVVAALRTFSTLSKVFCVEYNDAHVQTMRETLRNEPSGELVCLNQGDFFQQNWPNILTSLSSPTLILGNPPWVTNAVLSKLNGTNLPTKSNFQGLKGFEALTGKSNFDISEWMLIHLLEWSCDRDVVVAMLCKTSVARKVMKHRWKYDLKPYHFSIYKIDASKHFGASVDACLFVARRVDNTVSQICDVYTCITAARIEHQIGIENDTLVANLSAFKNSSHLIGHSSYVWRSGLKHDCSRVMELIINKEGSFQNRLDEDVVLEETCVYPLLKSSDIAKGRTEPRRAVIVTQKTTGEDTSVIQSKLPKTWKYLIDHGELLDRRGSSIYRNRPRFSIFGIGPYSFSPWKLAISGLYKTLRFTVVGPIAGKPIMLDDTCYFVACETEAEAVFLKKLLDHKNATELLDSFIFWDDKRPITVDLLKKIDMYELANQIGSSDAYRFYVGRNSYIKPREKELLALS